MPRADGFTCVDLGWGTGATRGRFAHPASPLQQRPKTPESREATKSRPCIRCGLLVIRPCERPVFETSRSKWPTRPYCAACGRILALGASVALAYSRLCLWSAAYGV